MVAYSYANRADVEVIHLGFLHTDGHEKDFGDDDEKSEKKVLLPDGDSDKGYRYADTGPVPIGAEVGFFKFGGCPGNVVVVVFHALILTSCVGGGYAYDFFVTGGFEGAGGFAYSGAGSKNIIY